MEGIDTYSLNVLIFIIAVCALPLIIVAVLYLASAFVRNIEELEEIKRRNKQQ